MTMTETASASFGSFCVSATRYRGAENVRVVPVVIAELKFGNIQRKVFAAHLVKAAHDAALQERPEAVNGLSMDNAVDVLDCLPLWKRRWAMQRGLGTNDSAQDVMCLDRGILS
jgi:hypothetical protein